MLKAGIIGCGFIAEKHLKSIASIDDIVVTAVCDISRENREKAIQIYDEAKGETGQGIQQYSNYQDVLRDGDIHFIVVSVLSGLHAEIAKEAIKKGKHVILEKPMALSIEDANEIIQLATEHRCKVQVCHQLRFRPLMKKIKQLIDQQALGDLYYGMISLRLNRSKDYYQSSNWKGTWEQDGGMLVNQGIHFVDLLLWMMGEPLTVYGELMSQIKEKEIEDIATGMITFQNGSKGFIEANTITLPRNADYSLSLFGEKGTMWIGGQQFNKINHVFIEGQPDIEKELLHLKDCHDEQIKMYQDFRDAIIHNQREHIHPEEGKKALEAIFALYQSHLKGMPVSLPIQQFSTVEMINKV